MDPHKKDEDLSVLSDEVIIDIDNSHNYIVGRLRSVYESNGWDAKTDVMRDSYTCTPDLIVYKEFMNKFALEIKTSKNDFQRCMYQCRFYAVENLTPYVVISKELFLELSDDINKLFNCIKGNTPGVLVIDRDAVVTKQKPDYNIP